MVDFTALGAFLDGDVLTAADTAYEQARGLFNGAVNTKPAAIACCTSTSDVQKALSFARAEELPVSVRSGGHGVTGACLVEDGLVLDLRGMNFVSVDPDARTAVVGGGASWGAVDRATQPHGLATTGGRVSTTGVGGLTLGGGSGWIERKFGLACDNLLSVELVLADGSRLTASEREHPDLFWALHGGGGNFGVATSFTFRLHEMPEFSFALLVWPNGEGEVVTRAYRDLIERGPDELGGGVLFLTAGPQPFVPAHLVGTLCCIALVTYVGPEAELSELVRPLLDLEPAGRVLSAIPYADFQCMLDIPYGFRNYCSAEHLRALPDEAVRRFCLSASEMVVPSPSQHALLPWGGAVTGHSWPMPHREAPWVAHPLGMWENPADDERARRWARGLREALRPWSIGAVYLNFIGDEGADRVVASFGRENYERLVAIKGEFDPDNVFNRWHNIVPETPPVAA